jgi:hypothetical protein
MAETDRAEAQRRRADARRQRRTDEDGAEQAEDSEDSGAGDGGAEDDSHAGLKHAAKVAAAGAAIGAAVGAALSGRDAPSEDGDDEPRSDDATERDDEDTPEAAVQQEEPVQQEQDKEEDKPPTDELERTLDDAAGDEPNAPQEARAGDRDSGTPQKGASPDETVEVAGRARQQLQALHGREPESVSSLARTAEGWTVTVEVVELQRVPDSTDVIASYELLLDEDKNLIRYERRRRYYRSQADRGGD